MFTLTGEIRDYAWGNTSGIPEILGVEVNDKPVAEYWLGAHPQAPSTVDTPQGPRSLDALLKAHPEYLGPEVAAEFGGRLPFLLKLLSARTALSIQAHPSLEQAKSGYADENARGIDLRAPHRNYKDEWHKPELVYALTQFDVMCGFRSPGAITATFQRYLDHVGSAERAFLDKLITMLKQGEGAGHEEVMCTILRSVESAKTVSEMALAPVSPVAPTHPSMDGCAIDPVELLRRLHTDFPEDPGGLVALMLNYVCLQPGEAMALNAGTVHAYVGGVAVEIMANSDNVLRGGLTQKHIDITELRRVVHYRTETPALATPDDAGTYTGATRDFALQELTNPTRAHLARTGPRIVLCVQGQVELSRGSDTVLLTSGRAVFLPDGCHVEANGTGQIFVASAGV